MNPPALALGKTSAGPSASDSPGPRSGWSRRQWWVAVLLIFGLQVGFIYALSDRTPFQARTPSVAPRLRLTGPGAADLLALHDPTLFALPHREGFSGPAWLESTSLDLSLPDWTEAPRYLKEPLQPLAAAFTQFVETNRFVPSPLALQPGPELPPTPPPRLPVPVPSSHWRLEGDLAGRALLTRFKLPTQAATDLLTNTVIQVLVDAAGRPVSLTLLGSSLLKSADQYALDLVRNARFAPLPEAQTGRHDPITSSLCQGAIIFEWGTVPAKEGGQDRAGTGETGGGR